MEANYKNWVPKKIMVQLTASTVAFTAGTAAVMCVRSIDPKVRMIAAGILGLGAVGSLASTIWSISAHNYFSYSGKKQLSRHIVEGVANYITLPEGGKGLDIGCGSGALTIACAKRNPQGYMVGIDCWAREYTSFSQQLCESNSAAEGADNTEFHRGDACKLDFPDEYFDAVTSNYVYHNIAGVNKQKLLRETFRVLKKGGTFAIHDIMSRMRYGDMQKFVNELYDEGFQSVELIDTTNGKFMTKCEAGLLTLSGSKLLVGRK